MPVTPTVATLAYIMSPDRAHVLMVHRNRRPEDVHFGKYNGLGGKLEPNEDIVACVLREIREESGIAATSLRLRGTINWTGFGKKGEDWFGFIFLVDHFDGTPAQENADGPIEWIPLARLADLPMWEGDRHFLPLVFDENPHPFHGVMPYRDGKPLSWHFHREG